MHWEKASNWELADPAAADPPAFGVPPVPADELPPHAAASRIRAAAVMVAAAFRAPGGHARHACNAGRGRRSALFRFMPAVLHTGG
jgi:hypothetical protein